MSQGKPFWLAANRGPFDARVRVAVARANGSSVSMIEIKPSALKWRRSRAAPELLHPGAHDLAGSPPRRPGPEGPRAPGAACRPHLSRGSGTACGDAPSVRGGAGPPRVAGSRRVADGAAGAA